MLNSFIWVVAIATKRRVFWIESVEVTIEFAVSGPKLEDNTLVWSTQRVDFVMRSWFVHLGVHHSTCRSCSPSVEPDLSEVVPENLLHGRVAAGLAWLVLLCALFGQLVSILIARDVRMSRNPLQSDTGVIGSKQVVYSFSKFSNISVTIVRKGFQGLKS